MELTLTLTVEYARDAEDDQEVDGDECRQILEDMVRFCASRGLLSGNAPCLYVEDWNYEISGAE